MIATTKDLLPYLPSLAGGLQGAIDEDLGLLEHRSEPLPLLLPPLPPGLVLDEEAVQDLQVGHVFCFYGSRCKMREILLL